MLWWIGMIGVAWALVICFILAWWRALNDGNE